MSKQTVKADTRDNPAQTSMQQAKISTAHMSDEELGQLAITLERVRSDESIKNENDY